MPRPDVARDKRAEPPVIRLRSVNDYILRSATAPTREQLVREMDAQVQQRELLIGAGKPRG
jgi:hypothetical protein